VFLYILRFILIFWIFSVLFRWFRRLGSSGSPRSSQGSGTIINNRRNANAPIDINHTGRIDDAEFEEIDRE